MPRPASCAIPVWLVLALLTVLRAAAADPAPAPPVRPNIILCMTDDQGWGDVSYNGLKKIQTPHLDAMAAAGICFNPFYAQQSSSPTRASVMTGRHPNRSGVFWPGMPLRQLGLAENTMVWFSSDNGGWLNPEKPDAHGTNVDLRGRKGDMWEGGIRVPGLIESPARIKPVVTEIPAGGREAHSTHGNQWGR